VYLQIQDLWQRAGAIIERESYTIPMNLLHISFKNI